MGSFGGRGLRPFFCVVLPQPLAFTERRDWGKLRTPHLFQGEFGVPGVPQDQTPLLLNPKSWGPGFL